MIVYYHNNGFYLFSAEQSEDIKYLFTATPINENLYLNKWDGTQWIEGLNQEEIQKINDLEATKFGYNDQYEINLKDDFSIWSNFYLSALAVLDAKGDKSKISWYKNKDLPNQKLVIEEIPVYTRWSIGNGKLAQLKLKRDLKIRFYRYNGTFVEVDLPTKTYNEKERVDSDKKSRSNMVETCRKNTGIYIYTTNLQKGKPQNINPELDEALNLFKTLQAYITVYREDREHLPLVGALQNTVATTFLPQETINFIINQLNINFY